MTSENSRTITRRRLLATTAASTALIAMPYVRGAHAAGKLSVGLWDHWVPGANDVSRKIIEEWGEKEKVNVQIDYITSQGEKLRLTMAAEAQAKSGHDLLNAGSVWDTQAYAELLEPMNDIMEPLIKQNGAVNPTVEYLGRSGDKWLAVPGTIGSQIKGPCSRIDLLKKHAGIDIQAMYPAGGPPNADNWNLDTFLKAAEACQKAGFPFGIGLGTTFRLGRFRWRLLPRLRSRAGRQELEDNGQVRRGAPGARLLQEAREFHALRNPGMERLRQQQDADPRQSLAHHESTERLGGGQT